MTIQQMSTNIISQQSSIKRRTVDIYQKESFRCLIIWMQQLWSILKHSLMCNLILKIHKLYRVKKKLKITFKRFFLFPSLLHLVPKAKMFFQTNLWRLSNRISIGVDVQCERNFMLWQKKNSKISQSEQKE